MEKYILLIISFVFSTTITNAQTITYGSGAQLIVGDSASFITNGDLVTLSNSYIQIDPKGRITVNSAKGLAQAFIVSTVDGTGSLITYASSDLNVEIDRYVSFITGGTYGRVGNVSSPVQGATVASLGGAVKSHLESQRAGNTDPYTLITDTTTPLNVMEAYSVYHDSPGKTLIFSGPINGGGLTFPITSTQYNGTDYYGWNLIGNPYPSAISVDSIIADIASNPDLAQTIYYLDWTTSVWVAYNKSMGLALPYNISVIPVGQGFFIKKVDTTGDGVFTLKDEYRVHDNNNYLFDITAPTSKNQTPVYPPYYFELLAKNTANDNIDIAHYSWRDDATSGFDNEFDSYKFDATGLEHPNIFFRTGNDRTIIQQEPATETVNAGFYARWSSGMEVEVTVNNVRNFTSIILEDKGVNPVKFTELAASGASYSFTKSETPEDDLDRFVIHLLLEDLSDNDIKEESFKLYSSEKTIIFISPKGLENAEMKIFDSLGRCVKTTALMQGENKQEIKTELNTGIYIVKISSQEYNTSKTLLIK